MNKITSIPSKRKEAQWFCRLKLFVYLLNLRWSCTAGQDVMIWRQVKVALSQVIAIGDSVIVDDFEFLAGANLR